MIPVLIAAAVVVVLLIVALVVRRRRQNDGVALFQRQIDALSPEARRGVVENVQRFDPHDDYDDDLDDDGGET